MDKILVLEEIKDEVQQLQYGNAKNSNELLSRVSVLIEKIFDSKVKYLNELNSIRYFLMGINCGGVESKKETRWKEGKVKFETLINTLIYDLKMSKSLQVQNKVQEKKSNDKSKVFIVHGHDNEAKTEVARFIERLSLEARILHEQTSSGATIIEKLDKYTDVGFAIILYTPDDIGTVKSDLDNLNPRARQNVVFEHGLLIGKIGRNNVVALVKDTVEIPNDISGVVYETMDSKGAWKYQVAKELKASGYTIDMNAI